MTQDDSTEIYHTKIEMVVDRKAVLRTRFLTKIVLDRPK